MDPDFTSASQKRRTIEVETSKKVEEMRTTNITKKKERSLVVLQNRKPNMDLTIMMMRWCMLQ